MPEQDRVDRFVTWARNHKQLSLVIIAALGLSAVSQIVQSARSLVGIIEEVFREAPSPVTVDLVYRLSRDMKDLDISATVVNVSAIPLYLKCAGIHLDEGIVEHTWLTPIGSKIMPLAPGARAVYRGSISLSHRRARRDSYNDIWFSVESNSQTIFQSQPLMEEFLKIITFAESYVPKRSDVIEVVPASTARLEHSSKKKSVSTFFVCNLEGDEESSSQQDTQPKRHS